MVKKMTLASALFASSVFGVNLGSFQVTPELGGNISWQDSKTTSFTYGGYARLWLGASRVVIAPQVKYDVMKQKSGYNDYGNLQVGGLLGFEVPVLPLTIYAGGSWSKFFSVGLEDTAAVNYGIKMDVPFVPFLTIGVDGVWQAPKMLSDGKRYSMNRIGLTLGLAF